MIQMCPSVSGRHQSLSGQSININFIFAQCSMSVSSNPFVFLFIPLASNRQLSDTLRQPQGEEMKCNQIKTRSDC